MILIFTYRKVDLTQISIGSTGRGLLDAKKGCMQPLRFHSKRFEFLIHVTSTGLEMFQAAFTVFQWLKEKFSCCHIGC